MIYQVTKVDDGQTCVIESDDDTGAVSVLDGPQELRELVGKAFSHGVWKNHSVKHGEAWLTSTKSISPESPSYKYVLSGMLAHFGFRLEQT